MIMVGLSERDSNKLLSYLLSKSIDEPGVKQDYYEQQEPFPPTL